MDHAQWTPEDILRASTLWHEQEITKIIKQRWSLFMTRKAAPRSAYKLVVVYPGTRRERRLPSELKYAEDGGYGPRRNEAGHYAVDDVMNWLKERRIPYEKKLHHKDEPPHPLAGAGIGLQNLEALDSQVKQLQSEKAVLKHQLAAAIGQEDLNGLMNLGRILQNARTYEKLQGIYFLILKEEIVYVGQSVDILARIGQHHGAGVEFDGFSYSRVDSDKESLHMIEAQYIDKFQPKLNLRRPKIGGILNRGDTFLGAGPLSKWEKPS